MLLTGGRINYLLFFLRLLLLLRSFAESSVKQKRRKRNRSSCVFLRIFLFLLYKTSISSLCTLYWTNFSTFICYFPFALYFIYNFAQLFLLSRSLSPSILMMSSDVSFTRSLFCFLFFFRSIGVLCVFLSFLFSSIFFYTLS